MSAISDVNEVIGIKLGDFCLAAGLHAGTRGWFKAKFVRARAICPEFLVKYVADIDGKTNDLLIPEVRNTWLTKDEIQPWVEPAGKRAPSSAKTRGQIADRDLPGYGGRKRKSTAHGSSLNKKVRFSDEVNIISSPDSLGQNGGGAAEEGSDDGQWLRIKPPSPDKGKKRLASHQAEGAALSSPSGRDEEDELTCAVCGGADSVAGNDILLCDGTCGLGYHMKCLLLPLDAVPKTDWFCPDCSSTGSRVGVEFQCSWIPQCTRASPREATGGGDSEGDELARVGMKLAVGAVEAEMRTSAAEAMSARKALLAEKGADGSSPIGSTLGSSTASVNESTTTKDAKLGAPPSTSLAGTSGPHSSGDGALVAATASLTREKPGTLRSLLHGKLAVDAPSRGLAIAPQIAALLREIPVGTECWVNSHGVTGFKQRFRAKMVSALSSVVAVKFIADEHGNTAHLCLPDPITQTVCVEEVSPLSAHPEPGASCASGAGTSTDNDADVRNRGRFAEGGSAPSAGPPVRVSSRPHVKQVSAAAKFDDEQLAPQWKPSPNRPPTMVPGSSGAPSGARSPTSAIKKPARGSAKSTAPARAPPEKKGCPACRGRHRAHTCGKARAEVKPEAKAEAKVMPRADPSADSSAEARATISINIL